MSGISNAAARGIAHWRNWSAGRPLAWVSTGGTGSPNGGGTPAGMKRLSCQVQLEAISMAVAPITAAARNQRLGDTTFPLTSPTPTSPTDYRPMTFPRNRSLCAGKPGFRQIMR
ncbi:hypothetical protein MSIM_36740 [Mycobacterium simiae]|nr:hypothetical protein MSIM_36740 [Mycobacterium simiae]